MIRRCYDEKKLKEFPTYRKCSVCEEWLDFQTFAKWFDENYYTCNNELMCLDKDILYKHNKIYSPETCIFVPNRINILFTKSNKVRGEYPLGVSYEGSSNKFKASCSIIEKETSKKKQKTLGRFKTSNEAFYEGYKPFKEAYIKEVANDYKDIIPENLYNAMINYVVEIDD